MYWSAEAALQAALPTEFPVAQVIALSAALLALCVEEAGNTYAARRVCDAVTAGVGAGATPPRPAAAGPGGHPDGPLVRGGLELVVEVVQDGGIHATTHDGALGACQAGGAAAAAAADAAPPGGGSKRRGHGHAHGGLFLHSVPPPGSGGVITLHVLEAGIAVHSVLVGLTIGVGSDAPTVRTLLIALCFHQFFEGIGVGSAIRSAIADRKMHCKHRAARGGGGHIGDSRGGRVLLMMLLLLMLLLLLLLLCACVYLCVCVCLCVSVSVCARARARA